MVPLSQEETNLAIDLFCVNEFPVRKLVDRQAEVFKIWSNGLVIPLLKLYLGRCHCFLRDFRRLCGFDGNSCRYNIRILAP